MPVTVLPAAQAVGRAAQADLTFYAGLRPVLIGPVAGLHRYAVAAEKGGIAAGEYDPVDGNEIAWPGKASGSTVDRAYAKLYADAARLNYFNKYIGVGGSAQVSSTYPNRVRVANTVFKTANDVDRSAALKDRDVKVGDVVVVQATVSSVLTTHTSTVAGFKGEDVAASVGSPSIDTNNAASQSYAVSVEQTADTPINDVVVTADGTAYDSLADGYINRTYTVTVTQSSTGGDATTALLRVRSSDGGDDADDVVPAAFGDPTAIGADGLELTFAISPSHSSSSLFGIAEQDLVVGQQWVCDVSQTFTRPTLAAGGTFAGTRTTTYVLRVTRGGTIGGLTPPQVTVSTTNGYDRSGPTSVTASGSAISIGTQNVTFTFTGSHLRKNDIYYVTATAASEGAVRTLVLKDDAPSDLRGIEVNVRLFLQKDGVLIPKTRAVPSAATNWTSSGTGVSVAAGLYLTDPEFTDGGELFGVPLDSANLYVEYREWLGGDQDVVEVATAAAALAAAGADDPDNPLGHAAGVALAHTMTALLARPPAAAATTTDVLLLVPLGGDPTDTDLWESALALISENDEAYGIVPLTDDAAIQDLVAAHVDARSADEVGFYRRAWLSTTVDETDAVVDEATAGDPVTATIAATVGTSPAEYTTLTASTGADFVTRGVRAGDTVRINFSTDAFGATTYDEYEVASVLSETRLLLASGPDAAVSVAVLAEVWRTYTTDELVTTLIARAAAYDSVNVSLVWPDTASFGGATLAGYNVCAALAGLAGSVPSHQGLRNVGLERFDSVTRSTRFLTGAQLKRLRDGGVTVVSQLPDGTVYVYGCVTTAAAAVGTREEMTNRNADMLRKAVQAAWGPYVGSGNVVSNIQALLDASLRNLADRLKRPVFPAAIGLPVGDMVLGTLTTDPDAPDTVDAPIEAAGLPVPLNNLIVRLPVSV
jgi:hypothetical protein